MCFRARTRIRRVRVFGFSESKNGQPEKNDSERERTRPMKTLQEQVLRFLRAEDGPTAVEYAVMLALIIVVCLVAITALGSNANQTFSNVALNVAAGS
jgi:pilus assembly protein Flp/PilA